MPGEPFGGSRPTQEERLTVSRYQLRFRQVHLDFHTSPHIPGIGKAKADDIMRKLGIAENRRVQGLGSRQREGIVELVAKLK